MNNDTEQSARARMQLRRQKRAISRARVAHTREISFRAVRSARDSCSRIYYSEYDRAYSSRAQEIPLQLASNRARDRSLSSRRRCAPREFPRLKLHLQLRPQLQSRRRIPCRVSSSRYPFDGIFNTRLPGEREGTDREGSRKNGAFFAQAGIYRPLAARSACSCGNAGNANEERYTRLLCRMRNVINILQRRRRLRVKRTREHVSDADGRARAFEVDNISEDLNDPRLNDPWIAPIAAPLNISPLSARRMRRSVEIKAQLGNRGRYSERRRADDTNCTRRRNS